ncbi:hypothetical protein V8F06_001936 [Rhypophila decipiens]
MSRTTMYKDQAIRQPSTAFFHTATHFTFSEYQSTFDLPKMMFNKALLLAPFSSLVSAGVYIAGFSDNSCNSSVGGTLISTNGGCHVFDTPYNRIQAAGGGSDSCFIELFYNRDCTNWVPSRVGPVNNPNLGSCIGPFPVTGGGFASPVRSARIINCPT